MKLGLIGLGLIGGSLARDARLAERCTEIIGFDACPEHAAAALRLGLVDRVVANWRELVSQTDLIGLAIPPQAIARLLPELLDNVSESTTIFDTASVKHAIAHAVAGHPRRGRFVSAHPMSGRETAGPEAAQARLFAGRAVIVCDRANSAPDACAAAESLFAACGLFVADLDSLTHDRHVAAVSHLPHALAFALAGFVADAASRGEAFPALAGGGLADMTRLARSAPALWADILTTNSEALASAIDASIDRLQAIRDAARAGDTAALASMLTATLPNLTPKK